MRTIGQLCAIVIVLGAEIAQGHAPPTPAPRGPLRVRGRQLVDASGTPVLLRGVQISGLNVANPTAADVANLQALNASTFGVIRERWNLNTVRLPVSVWNWQRDGQAYLDRVWRIVSAANAAELIVVVAAVEDARSGAPNPSGLPSPEVVNFWRAWATSFKDNSRVILDVFDEPSVQNVPGHVDGRRTPEDWRFWLGGGTAASGQRVAGMQDLADAIRSTGATQVVAVSSFHDSLDFRDSDRTSTFVTRT